MSTIAGYQELLELSFLEDAEFRYSEAEEPMDEDYRKTRRQAGDDLEEAARLVRTRPPDDPQLVCFAALMDGVAADELWDSRGMLSIHLWEHSGRSIPPATLVCYMMASYLEHIESDEDRMRQEAVEALINPSKG